MNQTEFKEKIHAKIDSINDEDILSAVHEILENGMPFPAALRSNEFLLQSIERGLKDIEEGRVVTLEEANEEIEKWLNK